MAKVYLRATRICRIDVNGEAVTYQRGDWFDCGKHQARQLEADGSAVIMNIAKRKLVLDLTGCGILVLDGNEDARLDAEQLAAQYMLDVEINADGRPPWLPFPRTLILGDCRPVLRLVPVGFHWLDEGWQLAVPMVDMETLAEDVGTTLDREAIEAVIHDLRVPVYDTRLIFVLRCPETEAMIENWADERKSWIVNDELAFLRVLYQATLSWTPLPPSWIEE